MGWAFPLTRWFENATRKIYGIQFHWILIISYEMFCYCHVFENNPIKDEDGQTDVMTGDSKSIVSTGDSRLVSFARKESNNPSFTRILNQNFYKMSHRHVYTILFTTWITTECDCHMFVFWCPLRESLYGDISLLGWITELYWIWLSSAWILLCSLCRV